MYYGLNLDIVSEEIFEELENIQDGTSSHNIAFEANNKDEAVDLICERLKKYFKSKLYKSDVTGYPIESD